MIHDQLHQVRGTLDTHFEDELVYPSHPLPTQNLSDLQIAATLKVMNLLVIA